MLGSFLFESARYAMTPETSSLSEVEVVAEFEQESWSPGGILSSSLTWNQSVVDRPLVAEVSTGIGLELNTVWETSSSIQTAMAWPSFSISGSTQVTQFETGGIVTPNETETIATSTVQSVTIDFETHLGEFSFSRQSVALGGESQSYFEQRELTIETPFSAFQVSRTSSSQVIELEDSIGELTTESRSLTWSRQDKVSLRQDTFSLDQAGFPQSVNLSFETSRTIGFDAPVMSLETMGGGASLPSQSLNLMQSQQALCSFAPPKHFQLTSSAEMSLESSAFLA